MFLWRKCGCDVRSNYIYKDNSNSFTADEFKRLRITSNGMVAGDSLPDGTNGGLGIDENGN